ncbi:MAG: gliding motility-associated C-terminal domain-containing protein [Saprospiraceae bacterium]|nr:gliding motility-associated C-terminal domain-containing protein [Saprospiraceae bacterium]
MKSVIFFILLSIIASVTSGQNLISNGGFEDVECPNNPINSFTVTPDWYVTGADAYWMHFDCPVDPAVSQSIVALDPTLEPANGLGYISFEGVLSKTGVFYTEGIGTELPYILHADRFYYLEMAFLNFPMAVPQGTPEPDCDPLPGRFLEIYFSDEKIVSEAETAANTSGIFLTDVSMTGELRLLNMQSEEPGFQTGKWHDYWNCFAGQGFEKHLAISGNIYKIPGSNSCFEAGLAGNLYYFGHAVDDIKLYELPLQIDTTMAWCGNNLKLDLSDLIARPYFDKAEYVWDDGFVGTERVFTSPGIYTLEMNFPCTAIPITIRVDDKRCAVNVFVPNVFSPNNDGVNDILTPFVFSELPFENYHFRIFNRWGGLVFQSDTPLEGWGGHIQNKIANTGVYFWTLEYILDDGSAADVYQTGDFMLLR